MIDETVDINNVQNVELINQSIEKTEGGIEGNTKEYYTENKRELNKQNIEYNKVYQNEKIVCFICAKTITRKSMFKQKNWPTCKAIVDVCKYYTDCSD